jgi:hypothetical protein
MSALYWARLDGDFSCSFVISWIVLVTRTKYDPLKSHELTRSIDIATSRSIFLMRGPRQLKYRLAGQFISPLLNLLSTE